MLRVLSLVTLMWFLATPAHAQVVQTRGVFSSAGAYRSAGTLTISSVLGDVIVGSSKAPPREIWHGFYTALPASVTGVAGSQVALVDFLLRPTPNPAAAPVVLQYGLALGEPALSLTVYDINGRLVRSLVRGPQTAGAFRTTWDLRSDRGEPVSPGIYFVRLRTSHHDATTRLAIVR